MDQETKEYLDRKFAEQAAQTETERTAAEKFIAARKKRVMGAVLLSSGFMLLLLCVMLYLLYRFQLRGFFH